MKSHPTPTTRWLPSAHSVLFSLLLILILGTAYAQPVTATGDRFLQLQYMKAEPGKGADYVKYLKEYWLPIHQDRVSSGKINSCRLYSVAWPNGEGESYDFVVITEYPNFAALESPYKGMDFKALLGETSYAAMNATPSLRKMVRTDTLALTLATSDWSRAGNNVLSVHFLRPNSGKVAEFIKLQRDYFLPMSNEFVASGHATGWAVGSVRFPEAIDLPYSHVAFNGAKSLTQMDQPLTPALRDKWRGPRSTAVYASLAALRSRVKGQLWKLEVQTEPRK